MAKRLLTSVLVVVILFVSVPAHGDTPYTPIEGKVLFEDLSTPLRVVVGDRGEVYILDGPVLKKYEKGHMTEVASLVDSARYFAPYGLGDLADLYTFRSGKMVYLNGAIYVMGYMVDVYDPPKFIPNFYMSPGDAGTGVLLGRVYLVFVRITNHFEPVRVYFYGLEDTLMGANYTFGTSHFDRQNHIYMAKDTFDRLLLNDPQLTKDWRYQDYTSLHRNRLIIPNLVKTPDGNMMTIKPTALSTTFSTTPIGRYYWDYYSGTLEDAFNAMVAIAPYSKITREVRNTHTDIECGAYLIRPDMTEVLLNEGFMDGSSQSGQRTVHSTATTFNRYTTDKTDRFPDNNSIYALPSYADPENTIIICNSTYAHKYNLKEFKASELTLIPGNQMRTGSQKALIPSLHYSTTHPHPTEELGIFFIGPGAVWRLYEDKYWQDLSGEGLHIPFNSTIDWAIDEQNRIAYVITDDNKLVAYDFSPIIPQNPTGPGQSDMPYRVMFDQSRQSMYVLYDYELPKTNDGKFYVPAHTIFNFLDIYADLHQKTPLGDGSYLFPVECYHQGTKGHIRGFMTEYPRHERLWADIDETLDLVYQLTGRRYTYSFDTATNTLYINSTPSSTNIFRGWNRW